RRKSNTRRAQAKRARTAASSGRTTRDETKRGRLKAASSQSPSVLAARCDLTAAGRGLCTRACQLVGEFVRAKHLAHDFEHAARVNRDGAVDRLVVDEVADERLDVAVKDEAHKFALLVDRRRAGVTADDVVGRDEVERRLEIERRSLVEPTLRQ